MGQEKTQKEALQEYMEDLRAEIVSQVGEEEAARRLQAEGLE